MKTQPAISMVVIGFNEAGNLHNTFNAIKNMNYPAHLLELIYVDSGSVDNSIEIAKQYCDKVFIEPEWPTAARNRNMGLIECSHPYCHFLDGDIEIDPDYIQHAVNKLLETDVQVVCGYLEEKSKKGLGKILLHDYSNRNPGLINAPGAGGTFLKDALIEINGWDERIPRGEEMEIGNRLIKSGYKIWYIDCKMGIHDFGITNLFKYAKKQINEGMSIGAVTKNPSTDNFYNHIRILANRNILFHFIVLMILTLSIILGNLWIIAGSFLTYLIYLFVKYRIIRKIRNPDTIAYHFLQNLTKTFELYGYIKFQVRFLKLSGEKKASFFKRMDIKAKMKN